MLVKATDTTGYAVQASDGTLGTVSDLLFDDASWTVRWLVVETGNWWADHRVLIPASAFGHPDTTAQAIRLGNVLKDAGCAATVFAARESTHSKINADIGQPNDPATKALFEFLGKAQKP